MQQLQTSLRLKAEGDVARDEAALTELQDKMSEMREMMNSVDDRATTALDLLKNSTANPAANYYWLLFVLMYAGVYLFN